MAQLVGKSTNPDASNFGSGPNPGVRAAELRRQSSSSFRGSIDKGPLQRAPSSAASNWGNEDEETLAKKHEHWKQVRSEQKRVAAEKIGLVDVVKGALAIFAFQRASHWFGFSARRVGITLLVLNILRAFWRARAPTRKVPVAVSPARYADYPILGNIGLIYEGLSESLVATQVNNALHNHFKTNEVVLFGGARDIAPMDPRDREHVLKTNWTNYVKNGPGGNKFEENFAEVMGRGIFAVDGAEWTDHRKVASHLFSANGLKSKMEKSFTEHGDKLVRLLEPHLRDKQPLDFQQVMQDLTFETICDIAFGVSPGSMEAGLVENRKIDFLLWFDRVQNLSVNRFIIPKPIWKTMRWLNIGSERVLREDAQKLNDYVLNIINDREARGDFEMKDDLLSMYVKTAKQSNKPYMMDPGYLIDAVINFMIAGRDTTSFTLTNMFKMLSLHPEAEKRMLQELDEVVGRDNNVTWDHVRELRFSGAVFNEVLRMFPPVAGDGRVAVEADVLPSGIQVEAGQQVTMVNFAIGRDPNLWDNPNEFQPERWMSPDGQPTRRPDEYVLPVFWAGPRLCLGKDMARLEAISICYTVLKQYRVTVDPSHKETFSNSPVIFYQEGLPVRLQPRID